MNRGVDGYGLRLVKLIVRLDFVHAGELADEKQFHLGDAPRRAHAELVLTEWCICGDGGLSGDVFGIYGFDVSKCDAWLVSEDFLHIGEAVAIKVKLHCGAALPATRRHYRENWGCCEHSKSAHQHGRCSEEDGFHDGKKIRLFSQGSHRARGRHRRFPWVDYRAP